MIGPETSELLRQSRKSWAEIHAYYQTQFEYCQSRIEHAPEGIDAWRALRDFAEDIQSRPHLHSLTTVGSLGIIWIFRNQECLVEEGCIVIGSGYPTQLGNRDITIGYVTKLAFNPATLTAYNDVISAANSLEERLRENNFIPPING